MSHSPWARVLELTLPGETDRLLLRMCTLEGADCAGATRAWLDAVGSPTEYFRRERHGRKRLLPLLTARLRRSSVRVPEDFNTILRAAELRETLRAQTFRRHTTQILDALLAAGVDILLLPGVALVPRHYREWPLRHCHDLDFWIAERDRGPAETALNGVIPVRRVAPADTHGTATLTAESGLQVALHARLSPFSLFEAPRDELLARRQRVTLDGSAVDTLSDADLLFYVCLRAACSASRRSLQWACDAFQLLEIPAAIDWEHFLVMAQRTGAGLPLSVMLRFLNDELGAEVPAVVVQRLADATEVTSQLEEAFCHMVVCDHDIEAGRLLRSTRDRRVRFAMIRHLIHPSPSFLSRERGLSGGLALSREYLRRVLLAATKSAGLWRHRDEAAGTEKSRA